MNFFGDLTNEEIERFMQAVREDNTHSINKSGNKKLKYEFPVCNHTKDLSEENIGYTIGVTSDGVPFEAEILPIKII